MDIDSPSTGMHENLSALLTAVTELEQDDMEEEEGNITRMEEEGNGTRRLSRKRKTPLPSLPGSRENASSKQTPKQKGKGKPMPKLKQKPEQRDTSLPSQSQTLNLGMGNYFEDIEINGETRLVDMHNLTNDWVCLTLLYFFSLSTKFGLQKDPIKPNINKRSKVTVFP